MTTRPPADCGHTWDSKWNGKMSPFPIWCQWCEKTRCWRCPPCHDENGDPVLLPYEPKEVRK